MIEWSRRSSLKIWDECLSQQKRTSFGRLHVTSSRPMDPSYIAWTQIFANLGQNRSRVICQSELPCQDLYIDTVAGTKSRQRECDIDLLESHAPGLWHALYIPKNLSLRFAWRVQYSFSMQQRIECWRVIMGSIQWGAGIRIQLEPMSHFRSPASKLHFEESRADYREAANPSP